MNAAGLNLPLLGLYTLASFLHFAHNGAMLASYPNMPVWITAAGVYATWLGIAVVGVAGYVLTRMGFVVFGLALLALYAIAGLDGLAHYALAPITAHSLAMNFTIGFEVVTASLLLVAIGRTVAQQRRGAVPGEQGRG
jgi:hypothetical protein